MGRRLAAILVADVVGYSRLLNEDEGGTLAALRERRKAVVEPLTKQHSGRVVKFLGDGVLIEFASAVNAVAFALDLQRRMTEMNEPVAETRRIQLRVGINLGEVIGEGADIFGDGVNIASRLEAIAEPGGIAISGKVHEEVAGKLDAAFADLGEQALKNISRPVRVYRLTTAVAAPGTAPAKAPSPLISVAVLPFTNMSGDASQEYFADGLTEDLITALAKSRHLHVLSRNSTFEYKGRIANIPEVGRQLGARYVLEGSVRTGGSRVRVTAQLIDAATGGHVWAERFDRQLADIFAVQDEIVGAIAGRLAHDIIDAAVASKRNVPTQSLTAYDHMLRGREAWRRGALLESHDHWIKSVEADPDYAAALAILSFWYAYDLQTQIANKPGETVVALARQLAERAVVADDGDAFTHHCLGAAFISMGELEKALHHIDLAISLNPHFPNTVMNRGLVFAFLGRHQEGLEIIEGAAVREPRLPPAMRGHRLEVHCLTGDSNSAQIAFDHIDNPYAFQCLLLATCHAQADRVAEARRALSIFEQRRTTWYDVPSFARLKSRQYRLPDDNARLLDGFRKLGFEV